MILGSEIENLSTIIKVSKVACITNFKRGVLVIINTFQHHVCILNYTTGLTVIIQIKTRADIMFNLRCLKCFMY